MPYQTPAECMEALQRLRRADAQSTRSEVSAILDAVLQATPSSTAYLDVLETLRSPLERALSVLARQYSDHALSPQDEGNRTLLQVTEAWQKLAQAYAFIAQDPGSGEVPGGHALLAQRRVHAIARALAEFLRARRMIPKGLWASLHESFIEADARGFAYTRAADPLNHAWQAQSAAEMHVAMLLFDLSNPFARSPAELGIIWDWAQYFAPYCSLVADSADSDEGKRTGYGVDLAADHGVRPITLLEDVPSLRRFDGSQLAEQFRKITSKIKKGQSPSEFGLGNDIPAETATRLLMSLYRPWARGSSGRRFSRRQGKGLLELTGDWRAIGFYIAGKAFEQPMLQPERHSRAEDIRLLTFGEQVARIDPGEDKRQKHLEMDRVAQRRGFVCTQWEILDQSIGGFRLRRQGSSDPLEHRELVALRPSDGKSFLLGMVSWVMYRDDGTLEAGINQLSGLPSAVAIRTVGLGKDRFDPNFQLAFQLSETPALKAPASLVLPAGYFQPFRVIELHDDDRVRGFRLLELITRGANFDQVSYESLNLAA